MPDIPFDFIYSAIAKSSLCDAAWVARVDVGADALSRRCFRPGRHAVPERHGWSGPQTSFGTSRCVTLSIMSGALRKSMTLLQFLDWEETQPMRYEFDGFRPIAMTGGSANHAYIQRNLAISVGGRLRGQVCRFVGSDLKIEVVGRIRYPDGFVFCSPLPGGDKVVRDPVMIFEVLSESTARTDLITKNHEYKATPAVRRYVILEQDTPGGTMFERVGDDWVGHLLAADAMLRMPEIGIELPLAELYEGVDLQSGQTDEPTSS
jgi:Uma2 family endonuclease